MSYLSRVASVFRIQPRSRWLYWLLLPGLVPLLSYVLVGPAYLQQWSALGGTTLVVGLVVGVWFWTLDRFTAAVGRRFPALRQTWQRVLVTTVACYEISAVFLGGLHVGFAYYHPFGSTLNLAGLWAQAGVPPEARAWLAPLVGEGAVTAFLYGANFVVVLLMAIMYEAFYLLSKWQESKLNYEHLKKVSLQSQLESLKSQINPHFLFNTLNTLSSLIADAPRQAELFVDEIARVYRYLLQTNEEEMTPLRAELAFIQSYYHLLKTRYGAGLELRIGVEDAYLGHCLPPLTLQMLVENAVKHNVIQAARPLCIDISTTPEGALCVRNNLQPKTTRLESTHVGLANITARYQLLAQTRPLVENGPACFTVTLPLLAPCAAPAAAQP